jgi:tetratricopeptide (TPR) repeat protein
MASSMGEDNNLEPKRSEPEPSSLDGEGNGDAAEAPGVPPAATPASAKGLTPGQRLAAKKAQKAQDKREFKDELKRKEAEAREKELEEANRLIAPQAQPALPDEVQKVAGTFSDFMHENRARILTAVVGVLAIALTAIFARDYMSRGSAEQANLLASALELSSAPIDAEDTDGKTDDGKPVFKTREDRAKKASEAFQAAVKNSPDSLGASWGRLGAASIELTNGHAEQAIPLYQAVYDKHRSDAVLGGRALEGLALSLEASGKSAEAQKRFEELKSLDKDASEYHLARLKLAAGDREGAKTLLKGLYDRLSDPPEGSLPSRYLKGEVEVRLSELDSSLVDKGSSGGEQQFSQEELQRLIEQLQRKGGTPGGAE